MMRGWPLTVRGSGALALAVACFVIAGEIGVTELVYFGVLLVAAVAVSLAAVSLTRRSDAVTRTVDPEVTGVGREFTVTVRVGVRTAVPTPPGTWHDTLPAGLRGRSDGILPPLSSGLRDSARTSEFSYTVTGRTRGIHSIGPLYIRATDPFGLATRRTRFTNATTVTIAPAVAELPGLADFGGDNGGLLHTTTDQLGQGSDNLVARPYAPGDSMRRIHWRATAHRDSLMVRQEEQESTPEATVVLDLSGDRWMREARYAPGSDPGFEAAVSAAVSVVSRLVHDGYAVEVLDTDGTVLTERIDGGDLAAVDDMLTWFARVTARQDDTLAHLPRLFAGTMTGPVVVITGHVDRADVATIASTANHSSLPVLISVSPAAGALEHAADCGWHVAALDADADFADTWSDAVAHGTRHVVA